MINLSPNDFSVEKKDSTSNTFTPAKIEEFIEQALDSKKRSVEVEHHLSDLDKTEARISEMEKEIAWQSEIEKSINKAINEKTVGKSKIQIALSSIFGSRFEEESLQVVEDNRYTTEWLRDRKLDDRKSSIEALIALQESVINNEDILTIKENIQEEANIVQRIAKGVCIGRHLQPKELEEFNHDPNAFINKLAKKVIDGETEPLTLEKEDYEQASAIYDSLLSYVGRTMSKKKAFEEAASKRIKSDFIKPQTHIKEGIESIASKVKPEQDSS